MGGCKKIFFPGVGCGRLKCWVVGVRDKKYLWFFFVTALVVVTLALLGDFKSSVILILKKG